MVLCGFLIGCKELSHHIGRLLHERGRSSRQRQKDEENAREQAILNSQMLLLERQRTEKFEKEVRAKEWPRMKDQIFSRYQLPIADDAKNIARDLFGKGLDMVSAFFVTDERVVKQIYIEGGDRAIEEYAKNLIEHAFIGGPITATLLRRLKLLEDAKRDGKVIDTEIDIDAFVPHTGIKYAIDDIELDGQIIPAMRKFSIRCEMTATITEGFRVGPFILYDELYIGTKGEIEHITDGDIKTDTDRQYSAKTEYCSNKSVDDTIAGEKYGKMYQIDVCPHGTDRTLYCNQCQGDIIVSPSKKKVIGICLDISGSMQMKLSNVKTAVIKVLDSIPVNSNIDVVLIIFSTDLRIGNYEDIIPFGTEYTESIKYLAIKRINNIIAEGSTPLYDTINYFLDRTWSGVEGPGERHFLLDENRIYFPYTYLIIVSDGRENGSKLENLIYKGKIGSDAFFVKLKAYRDAGLVTEIIPFAYGDGRTDIRLIRELQNISGKKLINEICPDNIIESLTDNVDSILYGEDNLKMMELSISKKNS